jgi:imidazolonepropionase-like amidohydrolase
MRRPATRWPRLAPSWCRPEASLRTFSSTSTTYRAADKLTAIAQTHAEAVQLAIERGVTVAMGTDICITGMELPNSWGNNGAELAHLVSLGMTPVQAIAAATSVAPRTLGPQAPRSGQLAAGFDADFMTLDADPIADISVLSEPRRITGVWTGGRRVKG